MLNPFDFDTRLSGYLLQNSHIPTARAAGCIYGQPMTSPAAQILFQTWIHGTDPHLAYNMQELPTTSPQLEFAHGQSRWNQPRAEGGPTKSFDPIVSEVQEAQASSVSAQSFSKSARRSNSLHACSLSSSPSLSLLCSGARRRVVPFERPIHRA